MIEDDDSSQTRAVTDKIRVLIADDEDRARDLLRERVAQDNQLELIGECSTGRETIAAIEDLQPDLVLLDIQMPAGSGIDVMLHVGDSARPLIIFVTAYDKYAIKAFEYHALDYLLKPFNRARFEKAIARAQTRIRSADSSLRRTDVVDYLQHLPIASDRLADESDPERYLQRIIVTTAEPWYAVSTDDINWIEADDHYVRLHTDEKVHLAQFKISELEEQLDPRSFVRIHRSTIIRLAAIEKTSVAAFGTLQVILVDGSRLRVSRSHRERLKIALINIDK